MSNVIFKLNRAGVRELLKSKELQSECQRYANNVYAQVSGIEGYHMEPRNYPERNGYAIYASEYPAISDNLKNNTLLKAGKI